MAFRESFRLVCREVGEYNLWVQCIPGDGSCLFGSLVHQVFGIHPAEKDFLFVASRMRESIVDHLRRNFSRYWEYLVPFAEDFVKDGYVDIYDRVWRYLELLSDNRFWGGEECLSVACELYDIIITVWDERSGRFMEYFGGSPMAKKVAICFSGVHYDSVLFASHTSFCDTNGSINIPRTSDMIRVQPFYGDVSVYQSFLHQLRIRQDDSEITILRSLLHGYNGRFPGAETGKFCDWSWFIDIQKFWFYVL